MKHSVKHHKTVYHKILVPMENSKAGKWSDFAQVIAFNSDFKANLISLLYHDMGYRALFDGRALNKPFGISGICATSSNSKYTANVKTLNQDKYVPRMTLFL